jgi:hypothetical protein
MTPEYQLKETHHMEDMCKLILLLHCSCLYRMLVLLFMARQYGLLHDSVRELMPQSSCSPSPR